MAAHRSSFRAVHLVDRHGGYVLIFSPARASISNAGRRLFIEQSADKVLSTSVAEYLFGDLP